MANVSKILQTVGKGIKSAANSKAGKAVGKGTKKVVGTIFYPIKKAHQLQGANGFLNSTDKYTKGTLAGLRAFIATWVGALGIGVAEATNNKNPENDYRNIIIFSTLLDAGSGCLSGFLLGGPIGAAIGLVAGAVVQKDLTIGLLDKEFAKDLDYARKELKEERVARKEARAEQKIDKETLENIPKMTKGNSSFKPDTTDTKQTVDTTSAVKDSARVAVDTAGVADTLKTKVDTVEVKDSARVAVDTAGVADTLKTKIDTVEVKDSAKVAVDTAGVADTLKTKVDTVEVKDSARVAIDTAGVADTLKTKVDTVEVKDSARVAVDTVALADTLKTKVDTVEVKDSARVAVDTAGVADTLKTKVDTVGVKDTTKKEDVKPLKDAIVDNKSEEVKNEEKTNFWNGELNEIEVESIKVNKGDCLWNIAKRELQKANEGRRITNAQIVKQVKEFGRLNPELFGENPTYESLDFIREGATLKLSA